MSDRKPKDGTLHLPENLAEDPNAMAFVRTRLAADRTLMAWMRTSVSLIGFGFSIYKFFQYVERSGLIGPRWNPREPRFLAVALIGLGLVFLLFGLYEFRRFFKNFGGRAGDSWPTMLAAWLLWALGLATLLSIVLRTTFP